MRSTQITERWLWTLAHSSSLTNMPTINNRFSWNSNSNFCRWYQHISFYLTSFVVFFLILFLSTSYFVLFQFYAEKSVITAIFVLVLFSICTAQHLCRRTGQLTLDSNNPILLGSFEVSPLQTCPQNWIHMQYTPFLLLRDTRFFSLAMVSLWPHK